MTEPATIQNPQTAKRNKVVALVLGVSGLALLLYESFRPKPFPADPSPIWGFGMALILVGFVLFVFARFGRNKLTLSLRALVVFTLIMGFLWVGIVSPNFHRFTEASRQSEARTNLGGIFVAEMSFYGEHKRFGTFEEIEFTLSGTTNRYTYRIDVSGRPGTIIPARNGSLTPDNTIVPAGLSPDGQSFTATATGHIDNDDTIDQWHVNDLKEGLQAPDVNDRSN